MSVINALKEYRADIETTRDPEHKYDENAYRGARGAYHGAGASWCADGIMDAFDYFVHRDDPGAHAIVRPYIQPVTTESQFNLSPIFRWKNFKTASGTTYFKNLTWDAFRASGIGHVPTQLFPFTSSNFFLPRARLADDDPLRERLDYRIARRVNGGYRFPRLTPQAAEALGKRALKNVRTCMIRRFAHSVRFGANEKHETVLFKFADLHDTLVMLLYNVPSAISAAVKRSLSENSRRDLQDALSVSFAPGELTGHAHVPRSRADHDRVVYEQMEKGARDVLAAAARGKSVNLTRNASRAPAGVVEAMQIARFAVGQTSGVRSLDRVQTLRICVAIAKDIVGLEPNAALAKAMQRASDIAKSLARHHGQKRKRA